MLSVCFPNDLHFRNIIEKQQLVTPVFVFRCTPSEILITGVSQTCISCVTLFSDKFKSYHCPNRGIEIKVNSYDLSEALAKNKENSSSDIALNFNPGLDPEHLIVTFPDLLDVKDSSSNDSSFNHDEDSEMDIITTSSNNSGNNNNNNNTSDTVSTKRVKIINQVINKYKIKPLPSLKTSRLFLTNSQELKRILRGLHSMQSSTLTITLDKQQAVFESKATSYGHGRVIARHTLDIADYKDYDELYSYNDVCPKNIATTNTIVINDDANDNKAATITQTFNLPELIYSEKPTTSSNRVVIGLTQDYKILTIQYKIPSYGFMTYYFGELFY